MALALAGVAACSAPVARWVPTWRAPYGTFDAAQRERLAAARALETAGRRVEALDLLRDLQRQDPDNLDVGALVQDLEESLLHDGVDVLGPEHSLAELLPDDVLRTAYAARAEERPTVAAYVLSARAETDVIAAESQLGKALALDPTCAWAHYGRSHVLLEDRTRVDRWNQARQALDRALELGPGHLRARRLEAWMAAEEGGRQGAEGLLVRWIEAAEGDPRVDGAEVVSARLDLALLLLLRGEDGDALDLLEGLEGTRAERARRLALLTVARQEAGDVLGALDAALRAQGAAAGSRVLSLVQEALVLELFLGRPEEAEERWRAVAASAEGAASLGELIQGLRARVRLERAAEASGGDPTR